LGEIGQLETEIGALLIENEITTLPFSSKIMEALPTRNWVFPPEEIARRRLNSSIYSVGQV